MPPAIDIARHYAAALAALRAVHDFDDWLGRHWCPHCPAPQFGRASMTPLGDAGAIAWVEQDDTVLGDLPGETGCFCIPRNLSLPEFPLPRGVLDVPYGQDVVIRAAIRNEMPSSER